MKKEENTLDRFYSNIPEKKRSKAPVSKNVSAKKEEENKLSIDFAAEQKAKPTFALVRIQERIINEYKKIAAKEGFTHGKIMNIVLQKFLNEQG